MKRELFFSIFLLLSVACQQTTEGGDVTKETAAESEDAVKTTDNNTVFENPEGIFPQTVGLFTIGQVIPKLPEGLNKRKAKRTLNEEGEEFEITLFIIYNLVEDMLDLQMEENPEKADADLIITEIMVNSDYYKTDRGIGVGSTIDEFAEVYPDNKIWYTYVSDRYVMETPELPGVQFYLNRADCIEKFEVDSDMVFLKTGDFRQGSKIEKIRVY